ncbi:hypothetical protein FIBSPDRAFT_935432 [Athelia psychrophila]|uniref:Uncharacterized protein n=1 Tax=Athelia psychrophila TaxID=1759441 RepID=A0A166DTT3_9AGAM|nr:hypothetical protein FIBSPDRAFT_935432 [Fibularhizoctonia sp. CBS 109695]
MHCRPLIPEILAPSRFPPWSASERRARRTIDGRQQRERLGRQDGTGAGRPTRARTTHQCPNPCRLPVYPSVRRPAPLMWAVSWPKVPIQNVEVDTPPVCDPHENGPYKRLEGPPTIWCLTVYGPVPRYPHSVHPGEYMLPAPSTVVQGMLMPDV